MPRVKTITNTDRSSFETERNRYIRAGYRIVLAKSRGRGDKTVWSAVMAREA